MKLTKYVTVFVVQGNYGCGWEDECCSTDRREAREDLKSYRVNSPYGSRMITRRVLREKYETGNF
jgi:hypothetical protein